jgi:hypothetical protein
VGRPKLNTGTCAAPDCTRPAVLQRHDKTTDRRYWKRYCYGHLLYGPEYVPRKYRKHGTSRAAGYDPRVRRAAHLEYRYRMSLEEYDALVIAQGGRCVICDEPGELVVDHDHDTGAIRGLLHVRCNAALGAFNDRPDLLRRAAAYLEGRTDFLPQYSGACGVRN